MDKPGVIVGIVIAAAVPIAFAIILAIFDKEKAVESFLRTSNPTKILSRSSNLKQPQPQEVNTRPNCNVFSTFSWGVDKCWNLGSRIIQTNNFRKTYHFKKIVIDRSRDHVEVHVQPKTERIPKVEIAPWREQPFESVAQRQAGTLYIFYYGQYSVYSILTAANSRTEKIGLRLQQD